ITKLQYDKLDRLRKRIDDAHKPPQQQEVTTWLYDKSYKGLLDKVTSAQTTQQFTYDSLLRHRFTTQTALGQQFTLETTYDSYSRPQKTIYPTGLTVEQVYNQHGYLTAITDGKAQHPKTYWKALRQYSLYGLCRG
ncbi:hypothetical protein H0A36_31230, partial [Endozoicomonas sp. SM1973]